MGSQRLPGKSMLAVWRQMPLIELVLRRVSAARSITQVVLLTTREEPDDELVRVARGLGIAVFRGPEEDVLERFVGALRAHPADAVVRVCADNPFVEAQAIDELVSFFERAQPCDYASNHTQRSGLPDGIGAEILASQALCRAAAEARTPFDREHVPAFMLAHPERFAAAYADAPERPFARARLDIDTIGDYEAMRTLAESLPETAAPLWDRAVIMAAWLTASRAQGGEAGMACRSFGLECECVLDD